MTAEDDAKARAAEVLAEQQRIDRLAAEQERSRDRNQANKERPKSE